MSVTCNITAASISGLTPVTATFTNTAAADETVKLWAAAVDNRAPAGIPNAQGGEAVAESWLEASDDAGANWTPLTFPATWTATFAALSAMEITVPASGTLDVLIRLNVPAGKTSSGIVNLLLIWRSAGAA
jgi:hypothetical protein